MRACVHWHACVRASEYVHMRACGKWGGRGVMGGEGCIAVLSNSDFVHPGFALSVEGLQRIGHKSLKIYIVAKMFPVVMGGWWYLSCGLARIQ